MSKKAKTRKAKGGCSTTGKLYIVQAGKKITATKSKAKVKKLLKTCRKHQGKKQVCNSFTLKPRSQGSAGGKR